MIALGDTVMVVGGDLHLGKRIPVGTRGTVVGRIHRDYGYLYLVDIDGDTLTMSSDEISVVNEKEDGK